MRPPISLVVLITFEGCSDTHIALHACLMRHPYVDHNDVIEFSHDESAEGEMPHSMLRRWFGWLRTRAPANAYPLHVCVWREWIDRNVTTDSARERNMRNVLSEACGVRCAEWDERLRDLYEDVIQFASIGRYGP